MSCVVTMLGTGTSFGVPVIGCACAVCRSEDEKNDRMRCGARLAFGDAVVLIDTPTDLRRQALRFGIDRVDAVLYTHSHADHIMGADELRIFNFRQKSAIPCYGPGTALAGLRRAFFYIFEDGPEGGGKPRLDLHEVAAPFTLFGRDVIPVPVRHGATEVFGYRIGGFAYVTDVNHIPEASLDLLRGLDVLVLGALRYRPHPTHFSIAEACEMARRIGARRTVLTHMTHEVDYRHPELALPVGVEFGHDGLTFAID